MLVETSMGGSLTLDSYVSNVAMEESEDLMLRRNERRRLGAVIIDLLATIRRWFGPGAHMLLYF